MKTDRNDGQTQKIDRRKDSQTQQKKKTEKTDIELRQNRKDRMFKNVPSFRI